MKISKNDPRLTAYVLNELDTNDRKEIETALVADPELQNEVQHIKKSVSLLNTLQHETETQMLHSKQREKLTHLATPQAGRGWSIWAIGGSLATACFAIILFSQKTHQRTEYLTSAEVADRVPAPTPAKAKSVEPVKNEMPLEAAAPALADADSVGRSAGGNSYSADKVAESRLGRSGDALSAAAAPTMQARAKSPTPDLQLDVSLSQFLPTETEPTDVEINMNLTRDLKNCFTQNLSRHARYNASFKIRWQIAKGKLQKSEIEDTQNTGLVSDEISACVREALAMQNWAAVTYIRNAPKLLKFEAIVKIVSE